MTQVRDVRAADGVEVALAALVDEPAPLATHDLGVLVTELAVEDVALGVTVRGHGGKATATARKGRASRLAPSSSRSPAVLHQFLKNRTRAGVSRRGVGPAPPPPA